MTIGQIKGMVAGEEYDFLRTNPHLKNRIMFLTLGATKGGCWDRLYVIWQDMKARCEKSYATSYPRYGARGISICDDWHDFETFRGWAIANGYTDKLTIDRIDSDGNYEPSNCRWATYTEQAANKKPRIVNMKG